MIPRRLDDPIGYARFWMGDLFPLLQERADNMRLLLRSRDLPGTTAAKGLKRLNMLADKQLLRRLPKKENGSYVFVPAEFLQKHFLSGSERATQAAKGDQ